MLIGSRLRQSIMKSLSLRKAPLVCPYPKNFSMRSRIPPNGLIYLGRIIKALAFRPDIEALCEHTCADIGIYRFATADLTTSFVLAKTFCGLACVFLEDEPANAELFRKFRTAQPRFRESVQYLLHCCRRTRILCFVIGILEPSVKISPL